MSAGAPYELSPDEYRWSQAVKCPRQAVYQRRGAEAQEFTTEQRGIFKRGHMFGNYIADEFVARYAPHNIIREKEVEWPGGVLHTDIYVIPEQAAIEVKSSTSPDSLLAAAILQNAGEQHFDPDCKSGGVMFVNPVNMEQKFIPVKLNDELIERCEAIAAIMIDAEKPGWPLPDRTCDSPSDSLAYMCPFSGTCFEDWVEPLAEPADNVEIEALASLLYSSSISSKTARQNLQLVTAEEKDLRAKLAALIEPNKVYEAAGFKFQHKVGKSTPSFKLAQAIATGNWTHDEDDRFGPFLSLSKPRETWDVTKVGTVDVGDDEPPF